MDVKDIIRKRREELGLTYEQLGNLVGVGKSTVRKWETGMIENMRRDNIVALASALKISPATIMGWNPSSNEDLDTILLSKEEKSLLMNFNKLNDIGKLEANKRVSELTEISKYANNEISATIFNDDISSHLMPIAAHAKDGKFTDEEYEHDMNLMMNDDLWK